MRRLGRRAVRRVGVGGVAVAAGRRARPGALRPRRAARAPRRRSARRSCARPRASRMYPEPGRTSRRTRSASCRSASRNASTPDRMGGRMKPGPPAAAGDLRALTSDCVHCGFCLPTCPTYVVWNEEMDSPRGRIQLMEANLDGTLTLNPTVTQHFDRCLGCLACVTACPSGVRYDLLIEATRERVENEVPRSFGDRLRPGHAVQAAPLPAPDGPRPPARAARPQGPPPRAARGDDARSHLRGARPRSPPRRRRRTASPAAGSDPDRLRAVGRVRLGQRGDRARPRGGRLRGRRAAAGMLRRPLDACRPRRRGPRLRAEADRGVRRRRDGDRQQLRLWLASEGARTRPRRRPRLGRAGSRVLDEGP